MSEGTFCHIEARLCGRYLERWKVSRFKSTMLSVHVKIDRLIDSLNDW